MNITQPDLDSRSIRVEPDRLTEVSKLADVGHAAGTGTAEDFASAASAVLPARLSASSTPPAAGTMLVDSRGWPAVGESDIDELLHGTFTPAALTLIRFKTDSVLAGASCQSVTSAADEIRNEVLDLVLREPGRNLLHKAYGEPQRRLEWTIWALTRQQARQWRRRLYGCRSNLANPMPLVDQDGQDIPVAGRSSEHRPPDVLVLEKEQAALLDRVAQRIATQPDGEKLANLLTWLRAGGSWNAIAGSLQMSLAQVHGLLDELKHRTVWILHTLDAKDAVLAEKVAEMRREGWRPPGESAEVLPAEAQPFADPAILQCMPDKMRQALELKYIHKAARREMAQKLGATGQKDPLGYVRNVLYLARNRYLAIRRNGGLGIKAAFIKRGSEGQKLALLPFHEKTARVSRLVKKLAGYAPRQAQILEMRAGKQTIPQIAQELGIGQAAVRTQLQLAIRRYRALESGQRITVHNANISVCTDQIDQVLEELRARNPMYGQILHDRFMRNRSTAQISEELSKANPNLSHRQGQILVANAIASLKTLYKKTVHMELDHAELARLKMPDESQLTVLAEDADGNRTVLRDIPEAHRQFVEALQRSPLARKHVECVLHEQPRSEFPAGGAWKGVLTADAAEPILAAGGYDPGGRYEPLARYSVDRQTNRFILELWPTGGPADAPGGDAAAKAPSAEGCQAGWEAVGYFLFDIARGFNQAARRRRRGIPGHAATPVFQDLTEWYEVPQVKQEYPRMDQAVAQHYAREVIEPGSTTLPRSFVESARCWLHCPSAVPQRVVALAAGKRAGRPRVLSRSRDESPDSLALHA